MVGGMSMTDEAKMMGMTPAMFTLSGMKVLVPPIMRRPTMRLAYCTGMRRSPLVIQMTPTTTARAMMTKPICEAGPSSPGRTSDAARQARDDADEDEDRHAVADAPRRDELADPHDHRGARGEGEQDEREARDGRLGSAW